MPRGQRRGANPEEDEMLQRVRDRISQHIERRNRARAARLRQAAQEAEEEALEWLDEAARLDAEADRLLCR